MYTNSKAFIIRTITFLLVLINSINIFSTSPKWIWAKNTVGITTGGGINGANSTCIKNDRNGNSYLTGYYSAAISFDSISFTANNTLSEAFFIAKYSTAGKIIWAKSAGSSSFQSGNSIAIDNDNNVYVTGYFDNNTIVFDDIVLTNTKPGYSNIFIVKFNSSGETIWAKNVTGTENCSGEAITTDDEGNVYLTGNFAGKNLTLGSITLTNSEVSGLNSDLYVAKFNSSGDVLWAKSAGSNSIDQVKKIAIDNNGSIYLSGIFKGGSLNFNGKTVSNNTYGKSEIFLAKFDNNGNVLWAKSAIGSKTEFLNDLYVDSNNNVYIAGDFNSPVLTFDSLSVTNTNSYYDLFISKYDTNGKIVWVKRAGKYYDDSAAGLQGDSEGNIYVTGWFVDNSITFGSITLTNDNYTSYDIFVVKFDSNGSEIWAVSPTVSAQVITTTGISIDSNKNCYITGQFAQYVAFNSGLNNNTNGDEIFIAKLSDTIMANNQAIYSNNITVFPNPVKDKLFINHGSIIDKTSKIKIFDLQGQQLIEQSVVKTVSEIDLEQLKSGMYILSVENKDNRNNFRIIKQ